MNLQFGDNDDNAFYKAGPAKQELVPGSGVHISSARLHSIHSQCGKDPKKLFLLLIESFFNKETLATSLAHGCRTQTSKGSLTKALNQDVVKTVKGKTFKLVCWSHAVHGRQHSTFNHYGVNVSKCRELLEAALNRSW